MKELIRISQTDATVLEFSVNGGQNWFPKKHKGKVLTFKEITIKKSGAIVAKTDAGTRWSSDGGTKFYGPFIRFWVVLFKIFGPFMRTRSAGRGAAGGF
jgi:hypothetical protein